MKKADCKEDIISYFWEFVRWEGLSLVSENLDSYLVGEELNLNIKIAFISYSDILKLRNELWIREAEKHMGQLIQANRVK